MSILHLPYGSWTTDLAQVPTGLIQLHVPRGPAGGAALAAADPDRPWRTPEELGLKVCGKCSMKELQDAYDHCRTDHKMGLCPMGCMKTRDAKTGECVTSIQCCPDSTSPPTS